MKVIIIKETKPAKFCGGRPPSFLDSAYKSAYEQVKNNPNLCIVPDMESGWPQVMTLEQRDRLLKVLEECIPKSNVEFPSKIYFFGTGGPIEKQGSWENIFKDV